MNLHGAFLLHLPHLNIMMDIFQEMNTCTSKCIYVEDDPASESEPTGEEPIGVEQTAPITPELVITPQKRCRKKRRAQPSNCERNEAERSGVLHQHRQGR